MPYYQLIKEDTYNGTFTTKFNVIRASTKEEFFHKLLELNLIDSDLIYDIFDHMFMFDDNHAELLKFLGETQLTLTPLKNNKSMVELHHRDNSKILFPECFYTDIDTDDEEDGCRYDCENEPVQRLTFDFETIWTEMKEILGECGDRSYGSGGYADRYRYYSFVEVNVLN